jgi:hypothetical protein
MPRKPFDNQLWHVRLFSRHHLPYKALSLFSNSEPLMPKNMPGEAHCQEDRRINAGIELEFNIKMDSSYNDQGGSIFAQSGSQQYTSGSIRKYYSQI